MIELVNKKSSIALTNTNNNVEIQTPEQNPVELTDTQGSVAVGGNTGEANLQGPTVVGGYYIPDVDEEGNLTWEGSYEGMKEVPAANIKGKTGDKGDPFKYEDFTKEQLAALKGEPGYTPQKGIDYYTPTEEQEIINKVKNDVTKHNVMVSTNFRFMVFDILYGATLKIGDIIILSEQSEPDFVVILDSPAYSDNVITIDDTNNIPTPEYGAIYNIGNYCVAAFKCGADAEAVETALKRLDRLESKLAPQYIVEDHETAYEKTVPYYTCKYADLSWIEGATYKYPKQAEDENGNLIYDIDENGNQVPVYEKYEDGSIVQQLKDAKVNQIESDCANLFNVKWINQPGYENTETGYIVAGANGSNVSAEQFLTLTGLKPGDWITTTCYCDWYSGPNTPQSAGLIAFVSKIKDKPSYTLVNAGLSRNGQKKRQTSQIPLDFNNTNYYGIYFYGAVTSGAIVEYSEVMMCKENPEDIKYDANNKPYTDTQIPYQAYRKQTIVPIPEKILNIPGYGRYGSRLDFENKTLTVTYGAYEFKGNEAWGNLGGASSLVSNNTTYYRYRLSLPAMKNANGQYGICDRFPTHQEGWSACSKDSLRFGQAGAALYLYLSTYFENNEEGLKGLRKLTNGMRVCYPLATPETYEIDMDFDCLLEVGGTSKVRFVNEDKQPVPSKITYMLKEDAVFDE